MVVRGVLVWECCWCARGVEVHEPEAVGGVAQADDGGDAVLDDAGVIFVQKDIITAVVTQLAEGDEGFAQVGLDGDGAGLLREVQGEVVKVDGGVVCRRHDLSIGDANTKAVGGGSFSCAPGEWCYQAGGTTGV